MKKKMSQTLNFLLIALSSLFCSAMVFAEEQEITAIVLKDIKVQSGVVKEILILQGVAITLLLFGKMNQGGLGRLFYWRYFAESQQP